LRFCACSALLTYSSSSLKVLDSWSSTYRDMHADSWSCVPHNRGGRGAAGRGESRNACRCQFDIWSSTYRDMHAVSWSCAPHNK
jgi:hypothetical protein